VAQLVQYDTFPLQNIGFREGAHPIAAELFLYMGEACCESGKGLGCLLRIRLKA